MNGGCRPTKRRLRGPSHPPNPAPPSPATTTRVSSGSGLGSHNVDVDGDAASYIHPSRKRNWTPTSGLSMGASAPVHSQPAHPPRGEFTFNHAIDAEGSSTSTESPAFASLAQQQQHQQQQMPGTLAPDDHVEGPPTKKRRGVASTIVKGALNAALYTGAAAITAYSLWSSWGRRPEAGTEESSHREKDAAAGAEHEHIEPPPPYNATERQGEAGPSAPLSPSSSQTSLNPHRPQHIHISRRRRRPAFQTHRSSRSLGTPRKGGQGKACAAGDQSTASATVEQVQTTGDDGEGDGDEDEVYHRFQEKMNALIAEGQAALNSTADLDDGMEDDEDPRTRSVITASSSARGSLFGGTTSAPFSAAPATPDFGLPRSSSAHASLGTSNRFGGYSQTQQPMYLPEPSKETAFGSGAPPPWNVPGSGGFNFSLSSSPTRPSPSTRTSLGGSGYGAPNPFASNATTIFGASPFTSGEAAYSSPGARERLAAVGGGAAWEASRAAASSPSPVRSRPGYDSGRSATRPRWQ